MGWRQFPNGSPTEDYQADQKSVNGSQPAEYLGKRFNAFRLERQGKRKRMDEGMFTKHSATRPAIFPSDTEIGITSKAQRSESFVSTTPTKFSLSDNGVPSQDMEAAFVVYVFVYGYSITLARDQNELQEVFPYDEASQDFLRDIDVGRIPISIVSTWRNIEPQYQGCIVVEIRDYRSRHMDFLSIDRGLDVSPDVRRKVLRPTMQTTILDLTVCRKLSGDDDAGWTDADWGRLEGKLFGKIPQVPICLDPSHKVFAIASTINYNRHMFDILPKSRYKRRLSVMESILTEQEYLEETEAGCEDDIGVSPFGFGWNKFKTPCEYTNQPIDVSIAIASDQSNSRDFGPLPDPPTKMPETPLVSYSVSDKTPTRVVRFSPPTTAANAHVVALGGKRIEVHRFETFWAVLINMTADDTAYGGNPAYNICTNRFDNFRDASAFCDELKRLYMRVEDQSLVMNDTQQEINMNPASATCIDKVYIYDGGAPAS